MGSRLRTSPTKAELHEEAHALTVFRVLPNGEGRRYTAVTFPSAPRRGCEQFVRMSRAVGWIGGQWASAYGVLDVLNEDGDIVQDYPIPDARAFRGIKRKLDLRVDDNAGPDAGGERG